MSIESLPSFNPYSNGSYSGRRYGEAVPKIDLGVSILILMEVTLEAPTDAFVMLTSQWVSILILMEVTLEDIFHIGTTPTDILFQSLF